MFIMECVQRFWTSSNQERKFFASFDSKQFNSFQMYQIDEAT